MLGHEEDEWVNFREPAGDEFSSYQKELCPLACANLRQVLELHPDARIVVSSTWRHGKDAAWFNKLFKYFKIIKEDVAIGITPCLNKERGYEIEHWLNNTECEVEDFVIIDDDGDMGPYCDTYHFIQTDGKVGFDYFAMEAVDKVFAGFTLKYEDLETGVPYKVYSKPRKTNYVKLEDGLAYYREDGSISSDIYFYKECELFAKEK